MSSSLQLPRLNRVLPDESLYADADACRGAHKPYLPASCPFYLLRDDTEEYHIDWSRGEVDFILDCRRATDVFLQRTCPHGRSLVSWRFAARLS